MFVHAISVTAEGLICCHGPVGDRCPGSGKLPKQPDAFLPSPVSNEDPTPSPCAHSPTSLGLAVIRKPIPSVRVLERIPKVARRQCHLKLTTASEGV